MEGLQSTSTTKDLKDAGATIPTTSCLACAEDRWILENDSELS